MKNDDPRVELVRMHNQDVYLPSRAAWEALMAGEPLGELEIPMKDWIAGWLGELGGFEVARLGLRLWRHRWLLLPLLHLSGDWYRVHFEDVICEYCGRRCGPSAIPDVVSYLGTGLTTAEAWATFDRLRVQSCPHCSEPLRRRQTVWLAANDGGPAATTG